MKNETEVKDAQPIVWVEVIGAPKGEPVTVIENQAYQPKPKTQFAMAPSGRGVRFTDGMKLIELEGKRVK